MTSVATEFVAEFVAQAAEDRPVVEVEPGKSIQGQVLATKIPIVGEDVAEHELASPDSRALAKDFGLHGFAGIPLLANDRSIGVLNVLDKPIRRFTDDEVSLLTAFADQASLALEKARLLSEAEREKAHAETEKERSDALYQVSNRMANAHDTDEVLDLIVNEAARLVGANAAYIRLLDGNALVPSAATKTAAEYVADTAEKNPTFDLDDLSNPMSLLLATKQPRVIEDAAQDMRVILPARLAAEKYGFHGLAAVPLLANDRSIGVLVVMDGKTRLFTDDEVSLLTAFADQASLALERARLLNEAERERERSDALYQVSNKLASVHETDEVLDLIVNETPSGHVMATKEPLLIEDTAATTNLLMPAVRRLDQEYGFHSVVVVPLLANDRSIGVLIVIDTRIRRFTEDEVSLLTAFADQASSITSSLPVMKEDSSEARNSTP